MSETLLSFRMNYFKSYLYGFFLWFGVVIIVGIVTVNTEFPWSKEYFRITFNENSKISVNNSVIFVFLTNFLIITIYFKKRFKESLKKSMVRALVFNSVVTTFFFGNCIFGR